jgi:outer membrane protein assembly factor BamB
VGNGLVYVTSWVRNVYALKSSNGKLKWTFQTDDTFIGLQSSATLTADGRLLVGDSSAHLYCLDARNGTAVEDRRRRSRRTLLGVAAVQQPGPDRHRLAHRPRAHGRLVGLDRGTGAILWTRDVPDKMYNDTSSGSVRTASRSAAAASGARRGHASRHRPTIAYMNTVGCYTAPRSG